MNTVAELVLNESLPFSPHETGNGFSKLHRFVVVPLVIRYLVRSRVPVRITDGWLGGQWIDGQMNI